MAMNAGKWKSAKGLILKVIAIDPDYENAGRLLGTIDKEINRVSEDKPGDTVDIHKEKADGIDSLLEFDERIDFIIWSFLTTIGLSLSFAVVDPIITSWDNFGWENLQYYIDIFLIGTGAIIGASIGTLQWVVLRRKFSDSWLWIAASTVGWSIGWIASKYLFYILFPGTFGGHWMPQFPVYANLIDRDLVNDLHLILSLGSIGMVIGVITGTMINRQSVIRSHLQFFSIATVRANEL
jgi:hypothetical protein